jgi:hypothetical protein
LDGPKETQEKEDWKLATVFQSPFGGPLRLAGLG